MVVNVGKTQYVCSFKLLPRGIYMQKKNDISKHVLFLKVSMSRKVQMDVMLYVMLIECFPGKDCPAGMLQIMRLVVESSGLRSQNLRSSDFPNSHKLTVYF